MFDIDMKKVGYLIDYIQRMADEENMTTAEDVELEIVKRFNKELFKAHYSVDSGVSKLVFIPANKDFVIKIATDPVYFNLIYKEASLYEEAVKNGIAMFFPETYVIGDNTIVQQKINFSVRQIPDKTDLHYRRMTSNVKTTLVNKIRNDINKNLSDYRRTIDNTWLSMCILLYGKRKMRELEAFIALHQINDLHNSNVGYIKNRPVIFDFSGFFEI